MKPPQDLLCHICSIDFCYQSSAPKMKVPLLSAAGPERSVLYPVPLHDAIPLEAKVAVAAALVVLGASESAWIAAQNILVSELCPRNNGISFLSSVPFLLVPVFAAFADGLRGSVAKRQPLFTAGVIIAFLGIGLLGISARSCVFVSAMFALSYIGVSMMAALALGILLDRLHRCTLPFAVRAQVFYVAIPMLVGRLTSHLFVYFELCTRTFLIGFSLALLLVIFISLLVPDVVVLSKANLALEQTATLYSRLFDSSYIKILGLLVVWKVLPMEDATLESLYLFKNISPSDISVLKFVYYASRIFGAVKLWWLLDTSLFRGYFKANIRRALFFVLTAQAAFMFLSVIITAQPPPNIILPAAVHYFTSGVKDGFTFACILALGSRMHSEALNSFAYSLVVTVFTVTAVAGSAVAQSLDTSFSVSSGQAWIAVFICAVLHLVPIIMIRYTVADGDPRDHSSQISKGVSSLEITFEEVELSKSLCFRLVCDPCLGKRRRRRAFGGVEFGSA